MTILTENFTGSKTIPGTMPNWVYEIIITAEGSEYTISVRSGATSARLRTSSNVCFADANGAFRWKSNNAIISPTVCVETFVARIPGYDKTRQENEYNANMAAFLTSYRAAEANRKITREERAEMTAAFGFNKTVVNALTGRRTRTLRRGQ